MYSSRYKQSTLRSGTSTGGPDSETSGSDRTYRTYYPDSANCPTSPPALPYSAARFRSTVNLTRMGEL